MKRLNSLLVLCTLTILLSLSAKAQQAAKKWTLQECVDQAVAKNLTIKRADLQVENAFYTHRQSKYDLLPDLSASGNYSLNFGRNVDPFTNDITTEESEFSRVGVNSNVTLFSGMRLRNTIKRNKLLLEASKADYQASVDNVNLDVVTFYLNVIFNKELLKNAIEQLDATEQQLERTKQLVEAGSLPLSNELDLEAQLASDESNLVAAENTLSVSLLQLQQLLQIPANESFDIEVPELNMDDYQLQNTSAQSLYEEAVLQRPEVKSAELNLESNVIAESIAKGALIPTLSAGYSLNSTFSSLVLRQVGDDVVNQQQFVGVLQDDPSQVVIRNVEVPVEFEQTPYTRQMLDNRNSSIFVQLNVPIFNNFSGRTQIQQARINRELAAISLEESKNQLRQIIETAYNDASAAAKAYLAAEKQVAALRESNRVNSQRYELGAVNFTEYQVGQNNLNQAENDLVRSKFEYIFRLKIVEFYLGIPITL